MRKLLTFLGVVVVLAVAAGAFAWWRAKPATPDAFYDTPSELPSAAGELLRDEAFTRKVPAGAEAWRIMYTTTRPDGSQAVDTALVLASKDRPAGPRPVLAWAHGTSGIVQGCAPSILSEPFGGIPALDEVLDAGWVVVAADYVGLGTEGPHEYLVGDAAARNVLDSVRAARSFTLVDLADETVVWGHSQGGQTALFAGEIAPTYAPDVVLSGVAAIAPATNLAGLLEAADGTEVGNVLTSLAMVSWSEVYDEVDLDAVVRPEAQTRVRDIASRCLVVPEALVTLVEAVTIRGSVLAVDPTSDPVLSELLDLNSPQDDIDAPVFVAQGDTDEVVAPAVTKQYVDQRCEAGQTLDFNTYAGQGHLPIAAEDSPVDAQLVPWTTDRFAGTAAPPGCQRTSH